MTNNFTPELYTLGNGLRVGLLRTNSGRFAGRINVNIGAYHESPEEQGLAHFLEHVIVSGGSDRFTPTQNAKIREKFGYSNAATTLGRTFYEFASVSKSLPLALDLFSSLVFNPSLARTVIERERGAILREMHDARSNSGYGAGIEFFSYVYGAHPKSRLLTLDGDVKTVASAKAKDLRALHSRGYHAQNMDLMLAGTLPKDVEKLIERYFANSPQGTSTRVEFLQPLPIIGGIECRIPYPKGLNSQFPEQSSAVVDLAFRAPSDESPEYFATNIMRRLLEKRLFRRVRERERLCYYIQIAGDSSYNAGHMAVQTKVPSRKLTPALKAIFEEMEKLQTRRVSGEEVENQKDIIEFGLMGTSDSLNGQMGCLASYMDHKETPQDVLKQCERVTPEDVKQAARRYLPTPSGDFVLFIKDPLMNLK